MEFFIKEEFNTKWVYVKNDANLSICFCSFGASVYSLDFYNEPVILKFVSKEDFLYSKGFHGKTLGRVAGRLLSPILIDNISYNLKLEKGFKYALHGGSDTSLSYKNFEVDVKTLSNKIKVIFSYVDKDLENGFPGKCKIKITYEIGLKNDEIKLIQEAIPNRKTLINLSNHMYFIFNNDLNLNKYYLKMNASKYAVVDETILIKDVAEVPEYLNFTNGENLKIKLEQVEEESFLKTIDNTFIFDETSNGEGKVILRNNKTQLTLTTSYPAMNIYVDNTLNDLVFENSPIKTSRKAIALEPQLLVLNQENITFDKNKKYYFYIKYAFKKLEVKDE